MKFAEIDLLGVHVAPISAMLPLVWAITIALTFATDARARARRR